METLPFFLELGLLLALATLVSLVMRLLRQPLLIGYIFTGLIVGPLLLNFIRSEETLGFFSEIGIAFLLFTVGLGLNPAVLREFGKVAFITGIGQVFFTSVAGFLISMALGFSFVTSLYVSIALSFSSTIIILKLISDKGDLEKLYAKISIGFLLVQDFIAIILLLAIPIVSADHGTLGELSGIFAKAALSAVLVFLFAKTVLVKLDAYIAKSQELLFLFATSWGLGITALFRYLGFSLESGALIAGIALSVLPSRLEINSRLVPLRDFFIIIFFILLGSRMALGDVSDLLYPVAIFSLLVLVGNPLILMVIMGVLGYRRKTGLETGFTVAQISEFSLILVALGVTLGQLENSILSMVTMVGIITIFGSTYLILYSGRIYGVLGKYLKIFERKELLEKRIKTKEYRYFLFGCNRIGFDFIRLFRNMGRDFLVVDHDPEIISELESRGVDHEYGDAGDVDFLESLKLSQSELIVSTVPELEVNTLIVREAKKNSNSTAVVMVAHNVSDAMSLYGAGADYVVLPHFLGGKYASLIVKRFLEDAGSIKEAREEHLLSLKERMAAGHEHPTLEGFK